MAKRVMLSQHFMTHVVPPLPLTIASTVKEAMTAVQPVRVFRQCAGTKLRILLGGVSCSYTKKLDHQKLPYTVFALANWNILHL
jgi:hypothetical protein